MPSREPAVAPAPAGASAPAVPPPVAELAASAAPTATLPPSAPLVKTKGSPVRAGAGEASEPRGKPTTPRPAVEAREQHGESPPAETRANSDSQAECARLLQRLSTGETDQSLIDRIRTLHCR